MLNLIDMVISAIVEMGVQYAWDEIKHREAVISVLTKVGLPLQPPPDDFDAIYAHSVVQYGVFKPVEILDLFRHELIRREYQRAFESGDISILQHTVNEFLKSEDSVARKILRLELHPEPELEKFSEVFSAVVDSTRAPSEVKRDRKLNDIHAAIYEILEAQQSYSELLDRQREKPIMLRDRYSALIKNRTQIYGGRHDVKLEILEFMNQKDGGYLIITAPAGFGKTALVADMVSTIPDVGYHFFTSTVGIDALDEGFFLRNVVQQIASWHGYGGKIPTDFDELKALYHRFVDTETDLNRLLLIDGLDEVSNWQPAQYFGRLLPDGLHIILTARELGQDWQAQYRLPVSQTKHLLLGGLVESEVKEVLRNAGGGARPLAEDQELLDEIMRVASSRDEKPRQADPFYIRLLAEDAANGDLSPQDISQQPSGLHAYIDRWWQEIRIRMGEEPIMDLFGTLTTALGPIQRRDLQAINPSLKHDILVDFFDHHVGKVRRWVTGDDTTGYSLAHPRLQIYMRQKIRIDSYSDRVLNYCSKWDDNRSTYVLNHYAQHLIHVGQLDELINLIASSPAWMDAKFTATLGDESYLSDIAAALALINDQRNPSDMRRLVELHAAKRVSAERSTAYANVDLMTLAFLNRREEAIAYARLRSDIEDRVEGLAAIWSVEMGMKSPETSLLDEILDELQEIRRSRLRAKFIQVVGKHLAYVGHIERARILAQSSELSVWEKESIHKAIAREHSKAGNTARALEIARGLSEAWLRITAMTDVASILAENGDSQAEEILGEALKNGHQLPDAGYRATALGRIAAALARAEDDRTDLVLEEALEACLEVQDYWMISPILLNLSKLMADAEEPDLALRVAGNIRDSKAKAIALSEAAAKMAEMGNGRADAVFQQSIEEAEKISKLGRQANALSEIVVRMSLPQTTQRDSVIGQVLELTSEIDDSWQRNAALRKLAFALARIGDERAREIFNEAIEEARNLISVNRHEGALAKVAVAFARAGEARNSHKVAARIDKKKLRSKTHSDIAVELARKGNIKASEEFENALAVAHLIESKSVRATVLRDVAIAMSSVGDVDNALNVVPEIQDDPHRYAALHKILRRKSALLAQDGKVEDALAIAESIRDSATRGMILADIVSEIAIASELKRDTHYIRVLSFVDQIEDPGQRVSTLGKLAVDQAKVGGTRADELFERAITEAMSIGGQGSKGRWLAELCKMLAYRGKFVTALELATKIGSTTHKSLAIKDIALAAHKAEQTQATDLFDQAIEAAFGLKSSSALSSKLRGIAVALIQVGDVEKALGLVESIVDPGQKVSVLTAAATKLANEGDPMADDLSEQALSLAREFEDSGQQLLAIRAIAKRLALDGELDSAIDAMNSIRNIKRRTSAKRDVAITLLRSGQIAAGLSVLGVSDLDTFIGDLAGWSSPFEKIETDLSIVVIREAMRIAGWIRGDWLAIFRLLT